MKHQTRAGWTIVFDLDGTLVDTAPDLHASLNHCLEGAGLEPVPFDAVRGMIGQGAMAMIRKGISYNGLAPDTIDTDRLWQDFLTHYQQNICRMSRPYPGAEDLVDALNMAGATCAVCTNKTQALAESVLDGLSLSGKFAALRGADSVPDKKPHGDHIVQTVRACGGSMDRTIMVGDSQTDERAARNAGLPFIFVTFGYGPSPDGSGEKMIRANTYEEVSDAITRLTA
ncbi:HAD hydrolase-like protein [Henriciella sp.]|uniref:HAD hydrolase-like protein n=1 Tax=Henriciella sp. TaxID=1968823 RepID=UPI002619AB79|nr:HAD hydrolase-like protein [Henriciella sp.]